MHRPNTLWVLHFQSGLSEWTACRTSTCIPLLINRKIFPLHLQSDDVRTLSSFIWVIMSNSQKTYRYTLIAVFILYIFILLFHRFRSNLHQGQLSILHSLGNQDKISALDRPLQNDDMFTAQELLYFYTGKLGQGIVQSRLTKFVRSHVARPSGVKPNLRHMDYSQRGQSPAIDKLLAGRTNGFFLECGALGGEHISNTLFFELERDWTGYYNFFNLSNLLVALYNIIIIYPGKIYTKHGIGLIVNKSH